MVPDALDLPHEDRQELLNRSLAGIGFLIRTRNLLERNGIRTVNNLLRRTPWGLTWDPQYRQDNA